MSLIKGTHLDAPFSRVVDGDTIRVFLPNSSDDESLRILSLDTEESNAGGGKPVTNWGKKAKERAIAYFEGTSSVTIEFPGNEDLETCLQKYRGNFGRLLVHVFKDGVDYQEVMIREGYSPYFNKYGNANFASHHNRYIQAERDAQRDHIGVWDQMTANGQEMRNYAALGVWWELRARSIDHYRKLKAVDPSILNSRLDFPQIKALAETASDATIFTALASIRRVGGRHGLISIGSLHQPFALFIPDMESDEGQKIIQLLETRYISAGESNPRRSYAYVTGKLSTYRDNPQMVIESPDQITDLPPSNRADIDGEAIVKISGLLPNPEGSDAGNESITISNTGSVDTQLDGWKLLDLSNNSFELSGTLPASENLKIDLPSGKLPLNNTGDEIRLLDADGKLRDVVQYSESDVAVGQAIEF